MQKSPIYKYYSQYGEDYILWKFFDYKRSGFFVDVGAFDGVHLSNSYSFEQHGWKGICVEPNPYYFELCRKNRPASTCIHAACIADENVNDIELLIDQTGMLSAVEYSEQAYDDLKRITGYYGLEYQDPQKQKVPARTVNSILAEHLPVDVIIDFISIDVEGTELDVLKGFDILTYRPRVVVVEANNDDMENQLKYYLSKMKGYHFARKNEINLFFVRDHEDIERMGAIGIECAIEKQMHPLGEKYTPSEYINGCVISEKYEKDEQVVDLLRKKIDMLLTRHDRINEKDHKINKMDELLEQKNNQLKQKDEQIKAKDQQLQQTQEKLTQEKNEIQNVKDQLKQRDIELTEKRKTIEFKEKDLQAKDKELTKSITKISEKDKALNDRKETITILNNEIMNLKQEIDRIDTEYQKELASVRKSREEFKKYFHDTKRHLDSILNSKTHKILNFFGIYK